MFGNYFLVWWNKSQVEKGETAQKQASCCRCTGSDVLMKSSPLVCSSACDKCVLLNAWRCWIWILLRNKLRSIPLLADRGSTGVFALNASDWDSTQGVPPKLHLQRTAGESVCSPSVMKLKSHPEFLSHTGRYFIKDKRVDQTHFFYFRLGFLEPCHAHINYELCSFCVLSFRSTVEP